MHGHPDSEEGEQQNAASPSQQKLEMQCNELTLCFRAFSGNDANSWTRAQKIVINITKSFKKLAKAYNINKATPDGVFQMVRECMDKLSAEATLKHHGDVNGRSYSVFSFGDVLSRPVRESLLVSDAATLQKQWAALVKSANAAKRRFDCTPASFNQTIYSAITAFACTFDLFKPTSRKTPGTFFEIVIGTLFPLILPDYTRTKHIPLIVDEVVPEAAETLLVRGPSDVETESDDDDAASSSVATDVVFAKSSMPVALVLPVKTTTRERIVQPFAHQRILDSYFAGRATKYKSVLIAVNEMQRDENRGVKSICVPGTIKLFQQHLAKLTALCYLDPPARYLMPDLTTVIPVLTLGDFVTGDALEKVLSDT